MLDHQLGIHGRLGRLAPTLAEANSAGQEKKTDLK